MTVINSSLNYSMKLFNINSINLNKYFKIYLIIIHFKYQIFQDLCWENQSFFLIHYLIEFLFSFTNKIIFTTIIAYLIYSLRVFYYRYYYFIKNCFMITYFLTLQYLSVIFLIKFCLKLNFRHFINDLALILDVNYFFKCFYLYLNICCPHLTRNHLHC